MENKKRVWKPRVASNYHHQETSATYMATQKIKNPASLVFMQTGQQHSSTALRSDDKENLTFTNQELVISNNTKQHPITSLSEKETENPIQTPSTEQQQPPIATCTRSVFHHFRKSVDRATLALSKSASSDLDLLVHHDEVPLPKSLKDEPTDEARSWILKEEYLIDTNPALDQPPHPIDKISKHNEVVS
jgi:hypothetical protein